MTVLNTDISTNSETEGRVFLPAGIALLFLGVMFAEAHVKLLWHDELETFWIGQQQTMGGIWRGLVDGSNAGPPLTYVLNCWSTRLLGTGPIAMRLAAMAGLGTGLGCLWALLRRRFAPIHAAAGCLALMATPVMDFGYDATSYSLLFGLGMAALLLGSQAMRTRGRQRAGWLLAMAVALAAGISRNPWTLLELLLVAVCFCAVNLGTWMLARFANRRTVTGAVALLCVLVLIRQAACGYALVHQRNAFVHFEDTVERSAAPGESVIVGDPLVAMPLYWYGSAALQEQIVFRPDPNTLHFDKRKEVLPLGSAGANAFRGPEERLLIASPDGAEAREFQANGMMLTEETATVRWDRLGGVSTPMADARTRILLAVPR